LARLTQIIILIASIFLFSCDEIAEMNETVLPRASGKSGEMLIVADSVYFNNKTGQAIKETFTQTQEGLPQQEALFDIIHLPPRSFAQIFKTNRNIVIVDIKPEYKNKLSINTDVWSKDQLIVSIEAPSDKIAAETIRKNSAALLDYFNSKENERLQLKYSQNKPNPVSKQIKTQFHFDLKIDDLYRVAKRTEDFLWIRKEKLVGEHPVSQGLIIYTYPYVSDSTFDVANLVAKRNEFTKNVQGTSEGTFMQSYVEFIPKEKEINLNGLYAKELRGLWHVKGDFMGGPFINYTFIDEKRNQVITVDGYVYCPRFDKREYLRELEAYILSIKLN
jgi:hypothetical protein